MRFLFLSDTHLGLDIPKHPRVHTPRRGEDFLANYRLALEPALRGEVDLVLHGGDLFDRSQPPDRVILDAAMSLVEIADRGVPVFIVPGNHERSWIPGGILFAHPMLHMFLEPKTHVFEVGPVRTAISGFSFVRDTSREDFPVQVAATEWDQVEADLRLFLLHQTFEGAKAGSGDYTFRRGPDIIPLASIPESVDVVMAGHMHRHQSLTDREGRLRVLYPGSTERTAYAEVGETKGYILGEFAGGELTWEFVELPTRSMVMVNVVGLTTPGDLVAEAMDVLAAQPDDGMIRMKIYAPRVWNGTVQNLMKALYRAAKARRLHISISGYLDQLPKVPVSK